MGDIILAVIVAAIVFFAARSVFVKKSGGCGGDCAHCGGCGAHNQPFRWTAAASCSGPGSGH